MLRIRVRVLASLLLLATACAPIATSATATTARPALLLPPAGPVQLGADQVVLLRSGAATFRELVALVDAARTTLHVEVYEFGHPALVSAVKAAQLRGVHVTVIDDPTEPASQATVPELRALGIDVVDYPVRRLMIDHVKLLVVDGSVAVVGGINWGTRSPANHDYDLEVRGPAVRNLDRVFMRDLVTCGRAATVPPAVPDAAIVVAATLPAAEIRPIAVDVIDRARSSLRLELFVITDTTVVRALIAAHARGVSLQVLLDPTQHSSGPSLLALQNAGVEVRLYRSQGELLHAKAIVADESRVLFGSANWSGGGFARNHELDVELPAAPAIAAAMLAQMSLDWEASA